MYKEKILAELRKKFPGLPANILGLIADKLSARATEESQIEGLVTELDNLPISITDYAAFLQKEGDRRVTEAEKKWKEKNPDNPNPTDDKDKKDPPPNNPLAKEMEELRKEFLALKQEKTQTELTTQLHAKLKEKKIPVQFAKGFTVDKAEDLDTVLESVEQHYTNTRQEMINSGLISSEAPVGGGTTLKTDNVEADIKGWAGAGKKEEK